MKKKERVYAFVKFRSGKTIFKRVSDNATWLFPLLAMFITGIIVFILLYFINILISKQGLP